MIPKTEFVEIINKLREVSDFVDNTNINARKLNDATISDFFNASSLSISHENIVLQLLENMFNDKDILSAEYDATFSDEDVAYIEDQNYLEGPLQVKI